MALTPTDCETVLTAYEIVKLERDELLGENTNLRQENTRLREQLDKAVRANRRLANLNDSLRKDRDDWKRMARR